MIGWLLLDLEDDWLVTEEMILPVNADVQSNN
jgi:hypothetical protein